MQLTALHAPIGCPPTSVRAISPEWTRTCASAIALLKSHKVDVAIIDLITGDERCDVVADKLDAKGIPWALSTGFEALDLRFQAVPLITKPYRQSEVHLVLRDLLDALAA